MSLPKFYANVCEESAFEYSDYKNFKLDYGSWRYYEPIKMIGSGTFAEVYEGINKAKNERIAMKYLKPIEKEKI